MDNLIDASYFVGDIALPEQMLTNIDDHIENHQKDMLKMLVGYDEYLLLQDDGPLIVGDTYDYGGYTVEYEGAKKMLAYYVYYHIIKERFQNVETIGIMMPVSENAQRVTVSDKLVYSWNAFVDEYLKAQRYLLLKEASYPKLLLTKVDKINQFGI